jgi:hypothetical protein
MGTGSCFIVSSSKAKCERRNFFCCYGRGTEGQVPVSDREERRDRYLFQIEYE